MLRKHAAKKSEYKGSQLYKVKEHSQSTSMPAFAPMPLHTRHPDNAVVTRQIRHASQSSQVQQHRTADALLHLQQKCGNRFVQRMIARARTEEDTPHTGQSCDNNICPISTGIQSRSGPTSSASDEIRTRQFVASQAETSTVNQLDLGNGSVRDERGRVQRDFAIEPPHPNATGRNLTAKQMQDAIVFNNRVVGPAGAGVIGPLRDVLGISTTPAVVDADFVNAVVNWQAMQGLGQDGKLGPQSAAPLFREIGAEGVGRGQVKNGPSYAPHGTIPTTVAGGMETAHFAFNAEFENDPANGVFPSCGELRQYIRWNAAAAASFGPTGVPHGGFPGGSAAGTWIEDRDSANHRYGHRSGRFADPQSFDQYLDTTGARNQAFGHNYRGNDTPGGPAAGMAGIWEFSVQCVDVCNNDAPIGGNDYLRIVW